MLSEDMRFLYLRQRTMLFMAQVAWVSCIASPYLKVPQGVRNGNIISYCLPRILARLPIVNDGVLREKSTKISEHVPFIYTCGRNLGVNKFKEVATIPISVKMEEWWICDKQAMGKCLGKGTVPRRSLIVIHTKSSSLFLLWNNTHEPFCWNLINLRTFIRSQESRLKPGLQLAVEPGCPWASNPPFSASWMMGVCIWCAAPGFNLLLLVCLFFI